MNEADRTQRRGLRALAGPLARVTAPALAARGMAEGAIITDWALIVGPELAACTAPLRLRFPKAPAEAGRGEGTLHVRVTPAAALEVQHAEPQILERINGYYGYRAVARLNLQQGPLERRAPPPSPPRRLSPAEKAAVEADLAAVGDETLRETLRRLGEALAAAGPAGRRRR